MIIVSRQLCITLIWGRKGSGKSLISGRIVRELLASYKKAEKRYPQLPKRKVISNQKYTPQYESVLGEHLKYWTNPLELVDVRNSDIIWDEIGKDFPAGGWVDTPKDIKQVFSHLRKRGNRLFANTQTFEDIDIAFRRQCDRAFQIQKIMGSPDISASLPAPKWIWGLLMVREFDPLEIERADNPSGEMALGFPALKWFTGRDVLIYDTTAELPPYRPDKMRHFELHCELGALCPDKKSHTKYVHEKY